MASQVNTYGPTFLTWLVSRTLWMSHSPEMGAERWRRSGTWTSRSSWSRVSLSDMTVPMGLPARAETQADDPAVRARAERITRRAAEGIIDQVHELGELGLVRAADVSVRVHSAAPLFKLYVLNNEEV